MIVDVEDSMFYISALDGQEMAAPELSGLVSAPGTSVHFISVQARDQFRPVRVHVAAPATAPPMPDDFNALVEFSVHSAAGLLVEDPDGERQRVLTRCPG